MSIKSNERTLYRVRIEKIQRWEEQETERMLVNPANGAAKGYYSCTEAEKEIYTSEEERPNGKFRQSEHVEALYSQEKDAVDVGDLACYINRVTPASRY